MYIVQFIDEMGWLIDDLRLDLIVVDLGPLGLDEDIYNTRAPCTWLVHVLHHREYRLSLSHKSDPRGEMRHGAALLLSTTPANSWASQTSALTPAKFCKLLDQLDHTKRNFSPRVWELMGALYMRNHCFLLGDNSSIITLYLNPFITSSYYKNTIR